MEFRIHTSLSMLLLMVLSLLGSSIQAQQIETGEVSYYADSFQGRPTASGEPYDRGKLTAAHRTLPFGTRIKVTRLDNGKSVTVTVNDRGPHIRGRIVDLSYAAAQKIGLVRDGIAKIKMEVVGSTAQPTSAPVTVINRPSTTTTRPTNSPPVRNTPAPSRPVNTADLPLRDHNGNLINATPQRPQRQFTNRPGDEGEVSEGTTTILSTRVEPVAQIPTPTATSPLPGMEDAAKHTPALYQFVAFELENIGYGVQVGAYFNFYKLMKAMDGLADKGINNTMVQSSLKDGKPVFRILVGPYSTRAEANNSKKSLERKKVKGIVKDLSTIE